MYERMLSSRRMRSSRGGRGGGSAGGRIGSWSGHWSVGGGGGGSVRGRREEGRRAGHLRRQVAAVRGHGRAVLRAPEVHGRQRVRARVLRVVARVVEQAVAPEVPAPRLRVRADQRYTHRRVGPVTYVSAT